MAEQPIVVQQATITVEAASMPVARYAYTVDETALALGCSSDLVRDLIANGTLQRIKLGGKVVIPIKAIEAMIDALLAGGDVWANQPKQRGGRAKGMASALSILPNRTGDGTRK